MTPIVGLSAAPQIKLALYNRFKAEADGGLLKGWAVDYEYNANAGGNAIYFGGWRIIAREDAVAEADGLLVWETVALSFYIGAMLNPGDVQKTDALCNTAATVIAQVMFNQPKLAGPFTWLGIQNGQGDGYTNDLGAASSTHGYAALVRALVTWSPQ